MASQRQNQVHGVADSFRAVLVTRPGATTRADFADVRIDDLPAGEVLVRVRCSALNYKDALAVTGRGRIVRRFPMVPGIDLAGEVVESTDASFQRGEPVFATGFGLGEDVWGGYAEYARVPAAHLQRVPGTWRLEDAVGFGTAGLTAMLAVLTLEEHAVRPASGEVLVTGASGGVGGFSLALLARRKFSIAALTGRPENRAYLGALGATSIIERSEMVEEGKLLATERWAGAVDSVGGRILANTLAATRRHGSVAACGLAGGPELSASVFPFILRGVNLLGIDSDFCPRDRRRRAWLALADDFPVELLRSMYRVEPLARVHELSEALLAGRVRGRVVLAVP